jgi:hypothetical protein
VAVATRFQMLSAVHTMQLVLERARQHIMNPQATSDAEVQDLVKAIDAAMEVAEKITPLMQR